MAIEGLDEFIQALGAVGGLSNPVVAVGAAFTTLASKLIPFVEAFAPGAVVAFGQAMRDTSAVIGSALLPVLQVMTGVVRMVGDALVPVVAKLAPVLQSFAQILAGIVAPLVLTFANVLGLVADAVKPLLPIFEGLASLQQAWNVVLGGLISGLGAFSKLLGPTLDLSAGAANLKNAFQSLAKAAILAVGAIAKWAGADSVLKGMIAALGGGLNKGGSTGFAVPTDVKIQDALSFSRDLAVRAFSAQGGTGDDKEETWRKEALQALKNLESGQTSVGETLEKAKADVVKAIAALTAAAERIAGGADKIERITNFANENPRLAAAAGWVSAPGWMLGRVIGRRFTKDEG